MAAILPGRRTLTREQLEAAILNHPDRIDFGPGLQIASAQFVGVRHVGTGVMMDAPKPPSHHAVSHILRGILGAGRGSQHAEMNLKLEDEMEHYRPSEFVDEYCSDMFEGGIGKTRNSLAADLPNGDPRHPEGNHAYQELHLMNIHCRPSSPPSSVTSSRRDVHTWEFVWKEGKAGGPLRRLKFVTNEFGYKLIEEKLDAWVSASHTSLAMNEAAMAALDACGGHLKENPGHQQYLNNVVHDKHIDGVAVDHSETHLTNYDLEREFNAKNLDDETYDHKEFVIDMHSFQFEGRIQPQCDSSSSILKDSLIMAVAAVLPVRFRNYNWSLLYSTSRDGISLNTLYRKVHLNGPSILVIRDWNKNIFGCYASEEWRVTGRSYGNGECFVFQVAPDMKAYKWTRKNHIFLFSNLEVLAIGGGDHYSILLNSDLLTGYSGTCETFSSPCLASSEEFTVSAIEVWGFQ